MAIVDELTEADLRRPGGEEDWNVAQAIGHDCEARAGLSLAAAKAAAGTFPADAPVVVPGIPGPADADRAQLRHKIRQSQRLIERAGRTVAGHELDRCPLVHPLVGRLRCGEWLLFAGVHDLMHLEQLHDLVATPMSPFRPDLVDCWMFRVATSARSVTSIEVLLIRRAPGRILPGLWQCVSGALEPDERIAVGALRELHEETGFGPADIEGFYDLDLVNQFHEPSVDAVMTAGRVRGAGPPGRRADALARARRRALAGPRRRPTEVVWPGYRTALERIRDDLSTRSAPPGSS